MVHGSCGGGPRPERPLATVWRRQQVTGGGAVAGRLTEPPVLLRASLTMNALCAMNKEIAVSLRGEMEAPATSAEALRWVERN